MNSKDNLNGNLKQLRTTLSMPYSVSIARSASSGIILITENMDLSTYGVLSPRMVG